VNTKVKEGWEEVLQALEKVFPYHLSKACAGAVLEGLQPMERPCTGARGKWEEEGAAERSCYGAAADSIPLHCSQRWRR